MSRYFYRLVSSRISHCSRLISLLRADSPRLPPISGGRVPDLQKHWEGGSERARAETRSRQGTPGKARGAGRFSSSTLRPCQLGLWPEGQGNLGSQ